MAKLFAAFAGGIVIGAGVSTYALSAASGEDEATRTAIAALKTAVVHAYVQRDAAALDRLYGDDYMSIDSQGMRRTKQDELRRVRDAGGDTLVSGRYDIVATRRWGNIAVASGKGSLTWRSSAGTERNSQYYSFNVFEYRDGRWVYVGAFLP